MVIEKKIRKHNFLRGGPEWVIIYGTGDEFNIGYVWAPYIMSVDPVVDESPALKTVNNRYYSTITL
jgi:hypothetical protein